MIFKHQIYYDGNCTDTETYCMRHGFENGGTGGFNGTCFYSNGDVKNVSLVIQEKG